MSKTAPLHTATTKPLQTAGVNLVLQRKCACGGGALNFTGECEECRKKNLMGLQTKLRVNELGDAYEQEADSVAEQVIRTSVPGWSPAGLLQGGAARRLRRHARSNGAAQTGTAAPQAVHDVLASPGRPLAAADRTLMDHHFGYDFGRVRIHTDTQASASARAVDAYAYTVGQHVVFAEGRFDPKSTEGHRLLAHELAHVVQQDHGAPALQRWAACVEANISGQDCPQREAGEAQRARADMVFLSEMKDPESGHTGALIANFDIGKSNIKSSLHGTSYWQQFLNLMAKEQTRWKLVGFSDCHENASLRKDRAEAVFRAIPKALRSQIVSREEAPASECMRGNVTGADRAMNRSVAFVLDVSIATFAEEEEEVIVGKTPLDRLRECQAGARVKTFPFRTTRFGGAPIMAHRDGDTIVVKLPSHVKTNRDFRKEVDTLPDDTFLTNGTRLEKDEIVRVRHYEPPHWYSLNITGDASDDKKTDYCVPAEKMLDFASATNKAFWVNVAVTGVEALTLGTPLGKALGKGVAKVTAPVFKATTTLAQPVFKATTTLAQKTAIGGMLALRQAAPSAVAGEASALVEGRIVQQVEERVVQQAVTQSIAPAAAAPIADVVAPRAITATVPQVGASAVGTIVPGIVASGGADVGGQALRSHFEREVEAAFSPAGDFPEGPYQTTQRLARGNTGERLAADALADDGHTILFFKPSILGTNQGGIDIVTLRNGVVNFIDNKALTRSGNVASVSALTTNFSRNMADIVADFQLRIANPMLSEAERQVFQEALDAIAAGRYARIVTNANVAPDTAILSGVTDNLARQGIGFIDVMSTP